MKITIIAKFNTSLIEFYKTKGIFLDKLNYENPEVKSITIFILKFELEKIGHIVQLKFITPENKQTIFNSVCEFNPDIIHIGSHFEYYGSFLKELKNKLNLKITAWTACPLPNTLDLSNIDFIFTSLPNYVEYFNSLGIKSTEAIGGYSGRTDFKHIKNINVGFIGAIDGLNRKKGYHNKRTDLVKYLSKHSEIHKWGYGFTTKNKIKNLIKKTINGPSLYKNYHGEIWGSEMLDTLNSFKININTHAEIAGDYSVNNRLFETTGANTLLITDHKKYINRYFTPDKEIITYKSNEECLEKINFLLNNPKLMNEITSAGNKRTLENYTVKHFVELYNEIITTKLN
jgi:hypothetical protein